MFAYYEDLDINLRARLRAWTCVYCPDAVVRHRYSGSTHGTRLKLGTEEVYLHLTGVWIKNTPGAVMLRHALSAAAFHTLIILFFIVARIRSKARMPRVPFFKYLGAMLAQRQAIQRRRKISPQDYAKGMLTMSFPAFVIKEF